MIFRVSSLFMREKECALCGERSRTVSRAIGVCVDCLRESPNEALKVAMEAHRRSRGRYGLPQEPPRSPKGVRCPFCANECRIPEGGYGFCGLVKNEGGRLVRLAGLPRSGLLDWYYDPLPTNCVAEWMCPGCTGAGYPNYAYSDGPEVGYYNLAVFYGACNLDCLFCQNWQYRRMTAALGPLVSYESLAAKVHDRVSCVCYFGGDPGPQMPHALAASRAMLERARGRIFRVCWETNGLMSKAYLKRAVELSLKSGGIVKFDVKAWTPSVYKALTGSDNRPLFENIKLAAEYMELRRGLPLVMVSVLLVPGYVDLHEVRMIAKFIADVNPEIPCSLLAFHPDYMMDDLPPTSSSHAMAAVKVMREEGVENVNVGNVWLLGDYYDVSL